MVAMVGWPILPSFQLALMSNDATNVTSFHVISWNIRSRHILRFKPFIFYFYMHTSGSSLMLGVFIPSVHSVLSPSPLPWHSHPRQMKHCLIQNQPIRVRIISSRQRQRQRTWRMERLPRRYEITTTTMMSILQ